jgi:hypothetical protein
VAGAGDGEELGQSFDDAEDHRVEVVHGARVPIGVGDGRERAADEA